MSAIGQSAWSEVNGHEMEWWKLKTDWCVNTADEEAKQREYARLMGIESIQGEGWFIPPLDAKGKKILDLGGGPVSLLLKCVNRGSGCVVADPGKWPAWVLARYAEAGILFVNKMAEGLDLKEVFDEVWCYNLLQHVQSPEECIKTMKRHGRVVRLFEWLGGVPNAAHPHTLNQADLDRWIGTPGTIHNLNWSRYIPDAYVSIVETDLKDATLLCRRQSMPNSDITVIVTSCGRFDLLRRTLESFRATYQGPVRMVITDDSVPDAAGKMELRAIGADFGADVWAFDQNHGQGWCLDFLYDRVTTPYLFHCEDDWLFTKPGYIEASRDILNTCPDVVIIGLDKNAEFESLGAVGERHETPNGTVYYDHPKWRITEQHEPWNGWRGFGLKRLSDYARVGRFRDHKTEDSLDRHFATLGLKSTWLGDGYCTHLGYGRSTFAPGERHVWIRESNDTQLRFHLLGLAHLPTSKEYRPCAYTQKIIKLARMLKSLGHHVTFYGGEGSDVECDEFVQVLSADVRKQCYGEYNWKSEFFKHDGGDLAYTTFARNAIPEIQKRKRDGDFLLITMGNYQQAIAEAAGVKFVVESGIGYRGVFAPYKVFESYAWMHHVYGLLGQDDGSWYDCVIPNYFDPADFPYQPAKGDYALYVGRLIMRKGLDIAVQVTKELGIPLIVAGQGSLQNPVEHLNITDPHVRHVGTVGPEERAELMGKARMVFVPTYYLEPFGGVAVEAQMCGTPVITTDWGVFPETVVHGTTGYRCRTFDDFVWAARNIGLIKPEDCRDWALRNYSLDRVGAMYQEYFSKVADIGRNGWYERRPERSELDWLRRYY